MQDRGARHSGAYPAQGAAAEHRPAYRDGQRAGTPAEHHPLLSRPQPEPPATRRFPMRSRCCPRSSARRHQPALQVAGRRAGIERGRSSYYRGTSLDETSFRLYATPRRNGIDVIEKALDAEIARLLEGGVTEEELARVKKRMLAEAVYARDSLSDAVRAFGSALTTGLTVNDVRGLAGADSGGQCR